MAITGWIRHMLNKKRPNPAYREEFDTVSGQHKLAIGRVDRIVAIEQKRLKSLQYQADVMGRIQKAPSKGR